MILANARFIASDGILEGLEMVIEGAQIVAIRERTKAKAIDLSGNYVAPGFIDLHLHGALGRDTMEASPEAFRTISEYHLSGGTTSLLLTTVAAPIDQILAVLDAVRDCVLTKTRIVGVH